MKIEELRIGNIVYDEDMNAMYIAGLWPVNSGKRYNFIDSAGNTGNLSVLTGIVLTEKILNKCGLINGGLPSLPDFSVEGLNIANSSFGLYYEGNFIMGDIIYLHQLQNLYFALSGRELSVK